MGEFFMLSPLASATLQRAGISKLLSGGARPWSAGQSALNFVGARNKTYPLTAQGSFVSDTVYPNLTNSKGNMFYKFTNYCQKQCMCVKDPFKLQIQVLQGTNLCLVQWLKILTLN